jgi:hypothetical protein
MAIRLASLRSFSATVCGTLGIFLILLGAALSLGARALLDADYFASHVADSLVDQRTAAYVAHHLTETVIEAEPDLILVRPLIRTAAEAVVSSAPFRSVVHQAVKRSHQLLTTEGGQEVLLSISDFGTILKSFLADRPELAAKIPVNAVAVLGGLEDGLLLQVSGEVLQNAKRFGSRPRLIFVLGALLLIAGVLLAVEHERALLRAGIAVTATAGVILLGFEFGSDLVAGLPEDPELGQALAGVWSTFVGGFWSQILIIGGCGLLMMAAATATLEVLQLEPVLARLRQLVVLSPTVRWQRFLRGLLLAVLGGLAVLNPLRTGRLVTVAVGVVICFIGLRELCRLAVDPAERLARRMEAPQTAGRKRKDRPLGILAGAVVVLVLLVGFFLMSGPPQPPSSLPVVASAGTCNGMPELCDRRLDEVVFACTHNAMGAADVPGWLFPNQQAGILTQLEDGVRALMLDVLPGIRVDGAVMTDLDDGELTRAKLEPVLGAEGLDAAMRIRERMLGAEELGRGLFLCHGLCELGYQPFVTVLVEIAEFLTVNPREVLVIIIEDAVPAADIAAAFAASGLLDLVWQGPVEPPWPTLGEMVAIGGRVLVLGENDTEGVPWYHPAWEVCQETPYHFANIEDLSNEPNRGGTDGSLLLMNHWITTPPTSRPSDAARINTREALMTRVEQCRSERGMVPNIIAVDFYQVGDLIKVVEELNRAGEAPEMAVDP